MQETTWAVVITVSAICAQIVWGVTGNLITPWAQRKILTARTRLALRQGSRRRQRVAKRLAALRAEMTQGKFYKENPERLSQAISLATLESVTIASSGIGASICAACIWVTKPGIAYLSSPRATLPESAEAIFVAVAIELSIYVVPIMLMTTGIRTSSKLLRVSKLKNLAYSYDTGIDAQIAELELAMASLPPLPTIGANGRQKK